MSRIISEQKTLELVPSGYDSTHSSYSSISSSYPITNAYDGSSTTNYAYITCRTGSQVSSYISLTFDVDIPDGATINSVVCLAKTRVSSTNYIASAVLQLYAGSTAKGSTTDFRSTTAIARSVSGGAVWTLSDIRNVEIRATATRGTSNTSRAAYIYFYGADLTITYTIDSLAYEVTASSTVSGITVSPASQDIISGENATILITGNVEGIIATDNGIDVTSSLAQGQMSTVKKLAESQDNNYIQSGESYAEYAVDHSAEDPYTSTRNMYASDEGYVDYFFDFSDLSSTITITDVTVFVYGHRENSTTDSTHIARLQLMSGSTNKGTSQEFTSTSNQQITISDPGTWTWSELQNAKLRFTVGYYGGLVCGISWYVTYKIDGLTYTISSINQDHVFIVSQDSSVGDLNLRVKRNGTWVTPTKVLVKQSGVWKEAKNIRVKNNGTWK